MRDVMAVMKALEQRGFVPHLDVEGVDEYDLAALARIVAAPAQAIAEQLRFGYSQRAQDRGLEGGLGVVEVEFDFGQSQHDFFVTGTTVSSMPCGQRSISQFHP